MSEGRQKRLCLVLDLDHTLVNSARISEVSLEDRARLARWARCEGTKWQPAQHTLFYVERTGMWTKLRPGVRDFLSALADKFQLWIHTNGTRYACSSDST